MNHKILVGLIASLVTTGAFAQSSVTIYGTLDMSLNYTTNQNAKGDHVLSLGDSAASTGAADGGQGALSGSRFGFKGQEDLGGGSKALFLMEAGINAANGQSGQQGQLFGRQEYFGLSNADAGQITLGRQYGVIDDLQLDYDPLGIGNYTANEWESYLAGLRFDNTIMYQKAFGPVVLNVQYSVGGVAGNTSAGSTDGFNLKYNGGPFGLGGAYQQSTDANGNKLKAAALDGIYNFGPGSVYLDYYHVKTDAGFLKGASLAGQPLSNTSIAINGNLGDRTDSLWVLALAYNFTPATTLTVGYMLDNVKQSLTPDGGSLRSAYAVLEYHLSKRTEVYLTADDSRVNGAEISAPTGSGTLNGVGAGQTNSAAVAAGLRVKF